MNDRELLESAATAVGIIGTYARVHQAYGDQCIDGIDAGGPVYWNPITVDGDAFRLAMKLDIKMHHGYTHNKVGPAAFAGDGEQFCIEFHEDHADGKCGAMRRAITRYAAEIGKKGRRAASAG